MTPALAALQSLDSGNSFALTRNIDSHKIMSRAKFANLISKRDTI
jgi:hypothetical protein